MNAGIVNALAGSALLMLVVLAARGPVRRWVGPRLAYALWALPALRLVLPSLPTMVDSAGHASVLFAGSAGAALPAARALPAVAPTLLTIWFVGALTLFAVHAVNHFIFCRRLVAGGSAYGCVGRVRVIATDVAGPLAFGVIRPSIAVPRGFERDYDALERELALAHEQAHHAHGDLIANWVSLAVLAAHWWNPVAWLAIRAFRDDQEFAADARVLATRDAGARPRYARVLAKAAGIGALPACNLPACNLNARSNLKGRLMMLGQHPRSRRRRLAGSLILALLGGSALAATAATSGRQAVTIGVKPDGAGGYALIVGGQSVAPGAGLPGGATLPADFDAAGGCSLAPGAAPTAMAIKGSGSTRTYTVMCGSAAPAPVRATLTEGLASLRTMRASVASQAASAAFPEVERRHALGAIDGSIREVEAAIAGR